MREISSLPHTSFRTSSYPPQIHRVGAQLRVSTLSAHAESFEDDDELE